MKKSTNRQQIKMILHQTTVYQTKIKISSSLINAITHIAAFFLQNGICKINIVCESDCYVSTIIGHDLIS
jgi:hypothetical protein